MGSRYRHSLVDGRSGATEEGAHVLVHGDVVVDEVCEEAGGRSGQDDPGRTGGAQRADGIGGGGPVGGVGPRQTDDPVRGPLIGA